MAYVRKYKSDEELRAARIRFCKKATAVSVEAKRRSKESKIANGEPLAVRRGCPMNVHKSDKEVFTRVATAMGMTTTALLHDLAENLRQSNPALFS